MGRATYQEPIDIALCIDIECTCDTPVQIQPMEVIEIACLQYNLSDSCLNAPKRTTSAVNKATTSQFDKYPIFHTYVRPQVNPELTLFCQELTGVLQSTVDRADTMDLVVERFLDWMKQNDLIDSSYEKKKNFAFASCGNFDLSLLAPIFKHYKFNNNHELPIYFKEWINVKKTFVNHKREWPKGLYHMLEMLGEEPSGRLHSAKDDCENLARIVECLHNEGCKFHVTNKVR